MNRGNACRSTRSCSSWPGSAPRWSSASPPPPWPRNSMILSGSSRLGPTAVMLIILPSSPSAKAGVREDSRSQSLWILAAVRAEPAATVTRRGIGWPSREVVAPTQTSASPSAHRTTVPTKREARGGFVNVGLLGAGSSNEIAVSDTGEAKTCDSYTVLGSSCWLPPIAASGTGSANGMTAISGTGNASSAGYSGTAISGTGTATATGCGPYVTQSVAVSGTNDASGCIAISGTGHASGTTTVSGGDLLP